MGSDRVRIEVADHVAVVSLTRAEKHNALDLAMFEGIIGAASRLTHEAGVRAVVLHGDGPSFCSGTGRVFSGEEARRLGVVTRLSDDPLAVAKELAVEIAGRSPDAIRAAKRLFDEAWSGPADDTLALEAELQLGLIGSPNQLAAVKAGIAKQPAKFTDPG